MKIKAVCTKVTKFTDYEDGRYRIDSFESKNCPRYTLSLRNDIGKYGDTDKSDLIINKYQRGCGQQLGNITRVRDFNLVGEPEHNKNDQTVKFELEFDSVEKFSLVSEFFNHTPEEIYNPLIRISSDNIIFI